MKKAHGILWVAAAMLAMAIWTMANQSAPVYAQQQGQQAASGGDDEEGGGSAPRRFVLIDTARFPVGEKEEIRIISSNRLFVTGPDYPRIETAKPGQVMEITEAAVIKLLTPVDLKFGDALVKSENVAPDYPGVYGLWLKKTGDGWHLIFNEKADVWGTMHDPEADVAEIPVEYTFKDEQAKDIAKILLEEETAQPAAGGRGGARAQRLRVNLEEADGGGVLRIEWGAHQWAAKFTLAG